MAKSKNNWRYLKNIRTSGGVYSDFDQYGQFSERLDSNTISYTSTATSLYVDISN